MIGKGRDRTKLGSSYRTQTVAMACNTEAEETLSVHVVYAQANELDDRLGELTSCISEMWSGRKITDERGQRWQEVYTIFTKSMDVA